jgi:hypothetical protein
MVTSRGRRVEGRIEDELRRLEKMEKHNEGIRKNSDGIADEIRKAQRQLDLLLRKAKSTLTALNVELHDETVEPPRVCRRPFRLSHAAIAGFSSMA